MGSSVLLCAIFAVVDNFLRKIGITTTTPRNSTFPGDYLWRKLCCFL